MSLSDYEAAQRPAGSGAHERPLSPSAARVVQLLYHHRLLKTRHVHEMITPHATSTRQSLYVLDELRRAGLADRVHYRGARRDSEWFVTDDGAAVVESGGDVTRRAFRMDAKRATGPLREHTLAVVETGLAFLRHGRRRGDDVDPFDWAPEAAHRFRGGSGPFESTHLIADALLHYLLIDSAGKRRTQMQFFIEVDRSTMPLPRLASKIVNYAAYYDYVPELAGRPRTRRSSPRMPAWRMRYNRFPRILIILADAPRPARLEHRMRDLAARLQETPYLDSDRPQFQVGAASLEQLQEHGPTAEIFLPLLAAQRGRTDFTL